MACLMVDQGLREICLFSVLYVIIPQNEVGAILKHRHIHANILSKTVWIG